MRHRLFLLTAVLLASVPRVAPAGIAIGDYNLITSHDLTGDNSDVQGRVLVGGTLGPNNFTFGGHLGGGALTPPAGIFNALGSGVQNLNTNGHNFVFGAGATPTTSVNGVTADAAATSIYTAGLASTLGQLSSAFAALSTAATIAANTVNASNPNQVVFTATTLAAGTLTNVAVFTVDQSFFSQNLTVKALNGINANTTVVINVTGGNSGNDALSFGNFSANPFQGNEARIIYNFENATSLNNLSNLSGSILAPNAVVSTGSSLVGSIYVKGIAQVGEIDLPHLNGTEVTGYRGIDPAVSAVPEPSTALMVSIGLALAGGVAWRRGRRQPA